MQGQKRLIKTGNFWAGKPDVYLIEFEKQKETAKENEEHHGINFARIMTRTMIDGDKALSQLPKDCRLFEDFSVYINETITLWVWSLNGISSQDKFSDANQGHLIYEQQVKVELLEYGYMLHRSLFERASLYERLDEILLTQEYLVRLDNAMRETSHFGEIRELLYSGWNQMGVPELKKSIEERLKIKELQTSLDEKRREKKLGYILSILFGFLAVPQLAEKVFEPIWTIFDLWQPKGTESADLFMISIAAFFVFILVFILLKKFTDS